MLKSIVNRVFGTRHERERRRVQPIVDAINEHYERLQNVSESSRPWLYSRGRSATTAALPK